MSGRPKAGPPCGVTTDLAMFKTPGDTFTLRERDTMAQKRITEAELFALLEEQIYSTRRTNSLIPPTECSTGQVSLIIGFLIKG